MFGEIFGYYIVTASLATAGYMLYFALTETPALTAKSAPRVEPAPPKAVIPPLQRAA